MKVRKLLKIQSVIEESKIPVDMTDRVTYWSESKGQWLNILDMDLIHVVRALSRASEERDDNNPDKYFKTQEWKDIRIKEINAMGYTCDDSHPHFDEVMSIYESDADSYEEFAKEFGC